ncbi:MAG: substrate-binding domain-containing protein [Thermoleophilaceae bacterium]
MRGSRSPAPTSLPPRSEQGVKPDVFAAANTKLPDQLFAKGLVEKPTVFAGNRLVLAVPAEGGKVTSLTDLERQGVTVAIGAPSVPVGSYTRTVLGKLPASRSRAILANVRSEEPDVAGIVGKLTQGAVDAGLRLRQRRARHRRKARGDRAARRGAALGRLRRGRGQGREAARRRPRRSSTASCPVRVSSSSRRPGSSHPLGVRRRSWFGALLVASLATVLCFLTLPIVAIFVDTGPLELLASLREDGALEALRLSVVCSAIAIGIIVLVGTPAAYLLATRRFRGRATVVTLIEIPLVLPPPWRASASSRPSARTACSGVSSRTPASSSCSPRPG